MARDEIGKVGGFVGAGDRPADHDDILLAVVGFGGGERVEVGQPVGTRSRLLATMPIALLMGLYLRFIARPGKRAGMCRPSDLCWCWLSIFGGEWVSHTQPWADLPSRLAALGHGRLAVIVYGFFASALPVWLLLAPRDYLSRPSSNLAS